MMFWRQRHQDCIQLRKNNLRRPKGSSTVKVKFTLTMHDVFVDGKQIGTVIIDWLAETNQEELAEVTRRWLTSGDEIARKMTGMTDYAEMFLEVQEV
jgi:hypothetical protein